MTENHLQPPALPSQPSRSPSTAKLAQALAGVQAKLQSAERSSVNPHLRNRYADLESIWQTLQPLLGEAGIAVTQVGSIDQEGQVCLVTTLLMGDDYVESRLPVRPESQKGLNAAQSFGVAWSYARRYALASICGVQTGEDTDGDTEARAAPKPSAAAPRETPPPAPPQDPLYDDGRRGKPHFFRYLERCQELKTSLDDDEKYYEVLSGFQLDKSNETRDVKVMSDVVVALQNAVRATIAGRISKAERSRKMTQGQKEVKRLELLTDPKVLENNSELSLRKYLDLIGGGK